MVLTITVVGNNQSDTTGGHTVLSPNELAQLMSGQAVTGLLNPDGSITLNSNMVSGQQLATMPTIQGSSVPASMSSPVQYTSRLQITDPMQIPNSANSLASPMQTITTATATTAANGSTDIPPDIPAANNNNPPTNQKKTGQKRRTAKQKQATQQQQQEQQQQQHLQQQQQQIAQEQMQSQNTRQIMTGHPDHSAISQQHQVVATVQLPNGQIGQLIAPPGGQFWSPNAINLQQLSMAVAAATGTMPQTLSLPTGPIAQSSGQETQQVTAGGPGSQMIQQSSMQHLQQPQQQSSMNNIGNENNNNQQIMTTVQLPTSQMGQIVNRPATQLNQLWSGGPISLSQLSALAQQGIVQLSPVQGMPGPNSHMIPQGIISQNGQPMQAVPLSSVNNQLISNESNDSSRWQTNSINQSTNQQQLQTHHSGQQQQHQNQQRSTSNINNNHTGGPLCEGSRFDLSNDNNNSNSVSHATPPILNESAQSSNQRKLKRLACTCPNCRDGDNSRSEKKKQHVCHFPDCNKVYGKTSHLRAHLRWHSGERPYVCNWSFCGKKFTRSDELQRHRRTHTGEKRFQCVECLKRFMRSDHLSKHLKTHLSSKKCITNGQLVSGMPTTISTTPQTNSGSVIKLESNMIDELALNTLEESASGHGAMRLNINN